MKQHGFHRNKTAIAHFSRSLFGNLVANGDQVFSPIDIFPLQDLVLGVLPDQFTPPNTGEASHRKIGRKIVEIALGTIAGYTPPDEIREDYMSCYEGDRFADTIPYAQSYREYLPELAKLLPGIQTPVRIVAGADDQVVPGSNAEFLHERLPNAQVDLIAGAGHFCWEEKPAEYAALLTSWWDRANAASKS